MGFSMWPKQLVPQEMAGDSQIQGVNCGIPAGLGNSQNYQAQRWSTMEPEVQRLKPVIQEDLVGLETLPLATISQSCRFPGPR